MIQVENLTFSYQKKKELFKNLTLELSAGSITGLLGKNGAGKTTLLKLLSGLIYPKSGSIKVLGTHPSKREVSFLCDVLFVPEEISFPASSMADYVKACQPFYPKFDHKKMERILEEFELDSKQKISKLSYGQKKKFIISFALASCCSFLIMDEPTNGLDIPSKSLFRKIVAGNLCDDQLVLISTHQVKDIENLLDKIVILDQGKIIFQEDTMKITDSLAFSTASSLDRSDIIYSELVPGGYKIITPNHGNDTAIDIELLFNSVISGKQLFKN